MSLLDDIKVSCRVSGSAMDSELNMLIGAAKHDLVRVGIKKSLVNMEGTDLENAFVKQAITLYCKSMFGFDNPDAALFQSMYRQTVCDMMNSGMNSAAEE